MATKRKTSKRRDTRKREFIPIPKPQFMRAASLSVDEPEPFDEDEFAEITDSKKRRYLQAVARWPGLTIAARKAGISAKAGYNWRHEGDPIFDAAFRVAERMSIERAQAELWRRGIDGYEKPVWHQGQLMGTERAFSDSLAMFMMKGAKPETYRERFEHSGPSGGPIETVAYSSLTDEQLAARLATLGEALRRLPAAPRSDDRPVIDVTPQDDPAARYAAVLAARKSGGGNGNGNGGGQ